MGAVNNNGVGVCGVAGGRYPEKGVRLMCLQIMDATLPDKGASLAKVMQYAAEIGAVIAQNSWLQERCDHDAFSRQGSDRLFH